MEEEFGVTSFQMPASLLYSVLYLLLEDQHLIKVNYFFFLKHEQIRSLFVSFPFIISCYRLPELSRSKIRGEWFLKV